MSGAGRQSSETLTERLCDNISKVCTDWPLDNPEKDLTVARHNLSLVINDLKPYIKRLRTETQRRYIVKMLESVAESSEDETIASQFCRILEVCYSKTDCFPQALKQLHLHSLLHQIHVEKTWREVLGCCKLFQTPEQL